MRKKKVLDIIKPTPKDALDDNNLQRQIILHVTAFGFCHIVENIVEAYREQARLFNRQANELERIYKQVKE